MRVGGEKAGRWIDMEGWSLGRGIAGEKADMIIPGNAFAL